MKTNKRLKDEITLNKQQKNVEGWGIRRIVNSVVQVTFFTFGILKGNCHFRPRVVVGGWSHSEWRSKYFIIGTMIIDEEQILVENWGDIYKLGACPQKEFFRKLDCGEVVQADPYYTESKERLDDATFNSWFRDRLELWENFNQEPKDFIPIAIRHSNSHFVIQDGAHRLSLRSLRGYNSHTVGIGIWEYNQRQIGHVDDSRNV
jgi:hypothetical protein